MSSISNPATKRFHWIIVAFAVVALHCTRTAQRHPNVLFITIDTFRADRISDATPNLLGLARRGVWFRNADAAVPMTLPSHATLLSGLLPLHHGLRVNGVGTFPANRETLATVFARAGYRTAAFVSAFVLDHRFHLDRGFATYDDAVQRDPNNPAEVFEAERRGGDTVDRALAWLRGQQNERWFVWVHLYDAHAPYAPPPPLPQTYDGEIRYVDQQVGRLIDSVDLEHTIVVVVGDHGESLGEHNELTHGLLLYESTLHVPLIVWAPGLRPRQIAQPVSTANVAPTIAALADLTMPKGDGRSLAPLIRNGGAFNPSPIYAESDYALSFGWTSLRSLRSGDIKVIRGAMGELFDLRSDPHEASNAIEGNRPAYHAAEQTLAAIAATAVSSSRTSVDAETRAKLASLGYVAPVSGGGQGSAKDPRSVAALYRDYERASQELSNGEAETARQILEPLVRADAANPTFRSTLARACLQTGNIAGALALYREAVAIAPGDADAWYNLASALQQTGNINEARQANAEAQRLDPQRADTYNVGGALDAESGNPAAAESQFRRAIAIDPRNARAYNNLGNALREQGKLADAASAFQSALQIDPAYAEALNGYGGLLVQQGRASEAIAYFDRAIEARPPNFDAQINRAIALRGSGNAAGAASELERILRELPPAPQFEGERQAALNALNSLRRNAP